MGGQSHCSTTRTLQERSRPVLELKGITKDYPSGDTVVHALKGISVTFRDQAFATRSL